MPNNEFMKQIFRAQDESNQDPKLFKELVMKYTGLTPRGFKNEMSGPVGKTTLLKGKPARDYYIKSDSKLSESEILFLKKYAGLLTEEESDQLASMKQTDKIDFSRFDPSMVVSDSNWKPKERRSIDTTLKNYDREIDLKNGVGVKMSIKMDNVDEGGPEGDGGYVDPSISGEFSAHITKNNHQDFIADIILILDDVKVYLHAEDTDVGYSIDGVEDIDNENIVDVDANVEDPKVDEQSVVNFAKQLVTYYVSQPRSPYGRV